MSLKAADIKLICATETDEPVEVETETTYRRLHEAGIIDTSLFLTDKGKEFQASCISRIKEMEKGIPVEDRPTSNIMMLSKVAQTWVSFSIEKQVVLIDNSRAILIATNNPDVKQKRITKKQKKDASAAVAKKIKDFSDNAIVATPKLFQRTSKDWFDLIWFYSDERWACIQAKFFNFIVNLYKSPQFYLTPNGEEIFVTVGNVGLNGVTAIIMEVAGVECENTKTGEVNAEAVQ